MARNEGAKLIGAGCGGFLLVAFFWLCSIALSLGFLAAAVWVIIQVLKATGVINA